MDLQIFAQKMNLAFLNTLETTAVQGPFDDCLSRLESTQRVEDYASLSPLPGVQQYKGHRRFGRLGEIDFKVANLEFDNAVEVKARDIRDGTGIAGYEAAMSGLAELCKQYSMLHALQTLAAGSSTTCWDGSSFFATSHNLGVTNYMNNLMSGSGTDVADGTAYKLILMVKTRKIKPVVWQNRLDPMLDNDTDDAQARMAKMYHWWCDMEGNSFLTYWFDAIQYTFTGQPTLSELKTVMASMQARLRTFRLPQARSGDSPQRVHEQLVFNPSTVSWLCSTALENKVDQLLSNDIVILGGAQTSNEFKGKGKLVVSGFLDA